MAKLIRVLTGIQDLCLWVSAAALAVLPIIVVYDVVMRYLFHAPTIWASEISLYLLQFLVYFSLGALVVHSGHVRVSFWIENLVGLGRYWGEILTTALILPYAGVLIWYGGVFAGNAHARGMLSPTLLEIPLWIPYGLIPAGGVLLALGAITKILVLAAGPIEAAALHGQGDHS